MASSLQLEVKIKEEKVQDRKKNMRVVTMKYGS
jgi:hypothetical protein